MFDWIQYGTCMYSEANEGLVKGRYRILVMRKCTITRRRKEVSVEQYDYT